MKRYLLILFCFFQLFAYSQRDTSQYSLLWEISRDDMPTKSYLFGTFHQNDDVIFEFPDSLLFFLDQSSAIILETDLSTMMGKVQGSGNYMYNRFNSYFEEYAKKNKKAEKYFKKGIQTAYGYSSGQPQFIDMYFKSIADNCGKLFFPLERLIDQQMLSIEMAKAKNNSTNEEEDEQPKLSKKELRNQQAGIDLSDAYLKGNVDSINHIMRTTYKNHMEVYDILITDRNLIMAAGIDTIIRSQTSFIAVGAGHIGGEEGLVSLLRKKGYAVRRVTPTYSKEFRKIYRDRFEECGGSCYTDSSNAFSIIFNGKASSEYDKKSGFTKVNFQEFGQGNIYTVEVYHPELPIDPVKALRKIAYAWNNDYPCFDSYNEFYIEDSIFTLKADVIYQGEQYTIQMMYKNATVYLVEVSGSDEFLKSDKAKAFFNSFAFLEINQPKEWVDVSSEFKLLNACLPEKYEITEMNDDKAFEKKLFARLSKNESLSITQYILGKGRYNANDSLFFNSHFLSSVDSANLVFSKKYVKDNYWQMDYSYGDSANFSQGRLFLMGNTLYEFDYIGKDSSIYNQFLNSIHLVETIDDSSKFVKSTKEDYSTSVPRGGFKRTIFEDEKDFSYTRQYSINDYEKLTSYNILHRQFSDWTFTLDNIDSLFQQIAEDVMPENTTTVINWERHDSLCVGNFSYQDTISMLSFQAKIFVSGKDIIVPYIVRPLFIMNKLGEDSYFLDSFQLISPKPIDWENLTATKLSEFINDETINYKVSHYMKVLTKSAEITLPILKQINTDDIAQDRWREESLLEKLALSIKGDMYDAAYVNWWKTNSFSSTFNEIFLANAFEKDSLFTWATPILTRIEDVNRNLRGFGKLFTHFKENPTWFYDNLASLTKIVEDNKYSQFSSASYFNFLEQYKDDSVIHNFLISKQFIDFGKKYKKSASYFRFVGIASQALTEDYIKKWRTRNYDDEGIRIALHYLSGENLIKVKQKQLMDDYIQDGLLYALSSYDSLELLTSIYGKEKGQLLFAYWFYADNFYNVKYESTLVIDKRVYLIGKVLYSTKKSSDYRFIALEVENEKNADYEAIRSKNRIIDICDFDISTHEQIANSIRLGAANFE